MKGKSYTLDKISITELFYEKWYLKGFDVAMKKIKQANENNNSNYSFPEIQINNLGLEFLFFKKEPHKTVELLKFNVELYPESWNAYDSLGEAYLQNGDNKLAIKAFEKSLKFNPNNTNAQKVLKDLKETK